MSVGCTLLEAPKRKTRKRSKEARARGLDLTTTSGRLLDALLRHRHGLMRAENGIARELIGPLRDAHRSIVGELAILAARDDALGALNLMRRERLLVLERRIVESIKFAETEALGSFTHNLRSLQQREVEIQRALLIREIPEGISLDFATPSTARLEHILMQPLGGQRWASRMTQNYGGLVGGITDAIAASITLGEGMTQAAARIQRATNVGQRQAVALARTEIQRVSNNTALESYVQNSDVIKGVQIIATLDNRTCLICGGLDGDFYPLQNVENVPPFHPLCRCFLSPVVRSLEEMGLPPQNFPPSTRASMDGQVPDTVDYATWFGVQSPDFQHRMLGPSRFKLFRQGKVKIDTMARDLRILRLDELPGFSIN